jgi:16S rRNA C967 or C1407 C5-methylase (RsmB/RsmF family)
LADVLALARERLFPWSFEETMAAARGYLEARGAESSRAEALARAWEAERDGPSDPLARFGMETSLPEWLARRLVEERGIDRARKLAQALLEPAPVDLRVRLSQPSARGSAAAA